MQRFLLFIFLLHTGCEASTDVYGCTGGWFEFTCGYHKSDKNFQTFGISIPGQKKQIKLHDKKVNKWWSEDNQKSLYHNTTGKYVKMIVKQLKRTKNFGDYECVFNRNPTEFDLKERHGCPTDFAKIAERGSITTINCTDQNVNFICKENNDNCGKIRGSAPLVHTISNVSPQDAGVYWCGYESSSYRNTSKKITLHVVEVTERQLTSGQRLSHQCTYTANAPYNKFLCKGEEPFECEQLVHTPKNTMGKFSIKDDSRNSAIKIAIREVAVEDSGTYWCGAEHTGKEKLFFHKLVLTVVDAVSPTVNTLSSTAETTKTTALSSKHTDDLWKTLVIITVVCVFLLLLAFLVFCLHRRISRLSNTSPGNQEDHCYEEIQERPQKPCSGTAMKTIYAKATFPTVTSGPVYSTVNDPTSTNSSPNNQSADAKFKINVLYSTKYTQQTNSLPKP